VAFVNEGTPSQTRQRDPVATGIGFIPVQREVGRRELQRLPPRAALGGARVDDIIPRVG